MGKMLRKLRWARNNPLRVGLFSTLVVMAVVLFYTPFSGLVAAPLLFSTPTPPLPGMLNNEKLGSPSILQIPGLPDVIAEAKPGVVKITSRAGQGSGFIFDEEGWIVTNAHVVEGSSNVTVVVEQEYTFQGEVIGIDEQVDLALVKIDSNRNFHDLPFIENSDDIQEGEVAIAIGYPIDSVLGPDPSVTVGIISARKRQIDGVSYVQTDASINPGNSGGPLLNIRGEVVGVNTAAVTDIFGSPFENIGLAITSNTAQDLLPALMSGDLAPPTPAPAAMNDDFDSATVITALPFTDTTDTFEATTAPDDPDDCFGLGPTVWYAFTPTEDMQVAADTFGSDYDTILAVYTGPRGSLTQIACNDDDLDIQSRVSFSATAGETYFFMVGAYGSGPGGRLVFTASAVDEAPTPSPTETPEVTPTPTATTTPGDITLIDVITSSGVDSPSCDIDPSEMENLQPQDEFTPGTPCIFLAAAVIAPAGTEFSSRWVLVEGETLSNHEFATPSFTLGSVPVEDDQWVWFGVEPPEGEWWVGTYEVTLSVNGEILATVGFKVVEPLAEPIFTPTATPTHTSTPGPPTSTPTPEPPISTPTPAPPLPEPTGTPEPPGTPEAGDG